MQNRKEDHRKPWTIIVKCFDQISFRTHNSSLEGASSYGAQICSIPKLKQKGKCSNIKQTNRKEEKDKKQREVFQSADLPTDNRGLQVLDNDEVRGSYLETTV